MPRPASLSTTRGPPWRRWVALRSFLPSLKIGPTLFVNLLGHGYDYRLTVAPWFRGLFSGSPANRPAESGTSGRRWRRIGVPY